MPSQAFEGRFLVYLHVASLSVSMDILFPNHVAGTDIYSMAIDLALGHVE